MAFVEDRVAQDGLTFDDVLLVPAYSEVLPKEVSLRSIFSRNIALNVPVVSAAMDTVTESAMAIALAREGGIGVIHKNMSISEQALQVRNVKRSENGMIFDPVTILGTQTIGDALRMMKENSIGGIPVVDETGKLTGILTNRDVRFIEDMSMLVMDAMTPDPITINRSVMDRKNVKDILQRHRIEKLPVVDDNGCIVGLITYKDFTKEKIHPLASKDSQGRLRVAAAVGISQDAMERVDALVQEQVDAVVLDSAHGHSKGVVELLDRIKRNYSSIDVVVGNIATQEAAKCLLDHGVDGIKVGMGPGSICTTRIIAGVGVPQLSAIYNVARVINGTGVSLIADGGMRYSGDIVKALAAGGDCVMCGSMFAGTDEAPGETIIYNGRKFKTYRGMGSIDAMKVGSKDRYFQEETEEHSKLVPEGIVGRVPYKGSISETVYQLVGGIRAGMGYCGAKDIEALKKSQFVRITSNGVIENHPHDITITKETPNYTRGE